MSRERSEERIIMKTIKHVCSKFKLTFPLTTSSEVHDMPRK